MSDSIGASPLASSVWPCARLGFGSLTCRTKCNLHLCGTTRGCGQTDGSGVYQAAYIPGRIAGELNALNDLPAGKRRRQLPENAAGIHAFRGSALSTRCLGRGYDYKGTNKGEKEELRQP